MVRLLAHIRNNSGLSVSVKIILYCTESDQDSSWSYISRIVITPDISMALKISVSWYGGRSMTINDITSQIAQTAGCSSVTRLSWQFGFENQSSVSGDFIIQFYRS